MRRFDIVKSYDWSNYLDSVPIVDIYRSGASKSKFLILVCTKESYDNLMHHPDILQKGGWPIEKAIGVDLLSKGNEDYILEFEPHDLVIHTGSRRMVNAEGS